MITQVYEVISQQLTQQINDQIAESNMHIFSEDLVKDINVTK